MSYKTYLEKSGISAFYMADHQTGKAIKAWADFPTEVAHGNIPGYANYIQASTLPITNTSWQDVWNPGGTMSLPVGLEAYEVYSSSADDAANGTGTRTVLVQSLDQNLDIQSTVVNLNGTTTVQVPGGAKHRFPLLIVGINSGNTNSNVGTVTLRVSGAGATRCQMQPAEGVSANSHYMVPRGKGLTSRALDYHTPQDNAGMLLRPAIMYPGTNTFVSGATIPLFQASFSTQIVAPGVIPEGSIIKYLAKTDSGTGNRVSVVLQGYLVDL